MSETSGGGTTVRITWRGLDRLVAHLYTAGPAVVPALITRLTPLAEMIRTAAMANTNPVSGKLAAAIRTRITAISESKVQLQVFTEGVPYARAQEEGATYDPRTIVPSKANVLAFIGGFGGGTSFAMSVQWPGATIPPKQYILRAMQQYRAQYRQIALAAMQDAMTDPDAGASP